LNAFGSAGLMGRAYLEASSFARFREAFGRPIASFPLVRENLAVIKAEEHGALESSFEVTGLVARIDAGEADEADAVWNRILVNANKYVTSLAATQVVHRGIETLGGNGTIEDFSPLPRLYRDAIVFESWEGTHNVLCAQVLRDLARFDAVELVLDRIPRTDEVVASTLDELGPGLRRSIGNGDFGALHIRRQLDRLVRCLQVGLLASGSAPQARAAAALLARRHLVRGWDPEADPAYPRLIDEVLGEDL
jgi:hypothetical protein